MIKNGAEVIANHPDVEPFIGVVVIPKATPTQKNIYVVTDSEDGVEYWLAEEDLVVIR